MEADNTFGWDDLVKMKSGTIIKLWFESGIYCMIMRGPSSLCAYLGLPTDHPLSGFNYDDMPIKCHHGLTYSGEGSGKVRPNGYYWYGWDYGHHGDYCFYYDLLDMYSSDGLTDKKWMVEDVKKDMRGTICDFAQLKRLAEDIDKKAKKS